MDLGSLTSSSRGIAAKNFDERGQEELDATEMTNTNDGAQQRERHVSTESSVSTDSYSNYIPTPPDGGWGWVIVAASLVCNIIVDGIGYSFGVFLLEFVDYFQESKGKTSMVGSFLCGTYLCAGPIVSALTNRYGCRKVTIIGSLLATCAFLLSTLSNNVDTLIVTYGFMGGIGFGMMYLPSIVSVGYYFEKKRALATGLAVCGSGIGTFIFAPLSNILLEEYPWKSALYIVAGIILNGCVCGSLMRPLEARPPPKKPKKPREKNVLDRFKEQTGIGRKRSESESSTAAYSVRKDPIQIAERVKEAKLAREKRIREECGSECSDTNTPLMTPSQPHKAFANEGPTDVKSPRPMTIPSLIIEDTKYCDSQLLLKMSPTHEAKEANTEVKLMGNGNITTELVANGNCKNRKQPSSLGENGTPPRSKEMGEGSLPTQSLLSPEHAYRVRLSDTGVQSDPNIWVQHKNARKRSRPRKDSITKEDYSRPMYRQDIFFSGSILNVKEFKSQPDMDTYVKSITHIPQVDEGTEDDCFARALPCISKSVRDTLRNMLSCQLLKNWSFVFLCLGNLFGMMGFYVPFVYSTDRAVGLGIDKADAAFLVSVIGITNTIGRIVFGLIADLPRVDALMLNNVCMFTAGAASLLTPFCMTYTTMIVAASVFGLFISAYISLTSIILCNLLGLEHLTNAFGLLTLARGISSICGPPIAGAIFDATGSYDVSFYVSGGLILLAGLLHMVLYLPCCKERHQLPNEVDDTDYKDDDQEIVDNGSVKQSLSVV